MDWFFRWRRAGWGLTLATFLVLAAAGSALADGAIDLAKQAYAAQQAGKFDDAIRLYDQALAAPDLSAENRAVVYNNRGIVQWAKGDPDRAIADYEAALKAQPDYAEAFKNRGMAYSDKGDFKRAIADFDAALRTDPDDAFALENRGRAKFYAGAFDDAVRDLSQALAQQPGDAYAVLWLHIVRRRAGQDDAYDFAQNVKSVDLSQWPGPILAYYLGETGMETIRLAIGAMADLTKRRVWACESNYYLGAALFLKDERDSAARFFQAAVQNCPANALERTAARFDLSRIDR